jgi:hypothetical protein
MLNVSIIEINIIRHAICRRRMYLLIYIYRCELCPASSSLELYLHICTTNHVDSHSGLTPYQALSQPPCSTAKAMASSENRAMCYFCVSSVVLERGDSESRGLRGSTYVDGEITTLVINVHRVLDAVDIRVIVPGENTACHRVALGGEGGGIAQLRV